MRTWTKVDVMCMGGQKHEIRFLFRVVIHISSYMAIHLIHSHKILTCGKKEGEKMKEKVWL